MRADRRRLRPGPAGAQRTGRAWLRLVADAYGLDRDWRAEFLTAIDDALDQIEAAARRGLDAGDPNAIAMWNRAGGGEKYARRRRW